MQQWFVHAGKKCCRSVSALTRFLLLAACSLMALVVSASAVTEPLPLVDSDIVAAVQAMQQARYFTFVMLVKMVQEKIPANTTFLMPNDRLLSTASIPENQVLEFLSRHSIPSPLLLDDLNKVEVVHPDVCNVGDSFRCHGINGVMRRAMRRAKGSTCTHAAPSAAAPEPASSPVQYMPPYSAPSSPSSVPPPSIGAAVSPAMEPQIFAAYLVSRNLHNIVIPKLSSY